jgi:uncharacterized protein (DUF1330 family)
MAVRMKYYLVAELTVHDPSWVADYVTAVITLIEKHGGRLLARTPTIERLEGNRMQPQSVVLVEWPSREAAIDFYESKAYQPYRERRRAGADSQMFLFAGEDIAKTVTRMAAGSREGIPMRTEKITPKVSTFFESYRSAFQRLDAEAIADLFVYPVHITGDDEQITPETIGSRDEWVGRLRQLLRGYRAMGFSTAHILDLTVIELSPRLFQAAVDWDLRDGAEASLYAFRAVYTLAEIGQNLRIAAIAHNELPRFRARRGGMSTSA